jgi:hypothetical protein
MEVFVVRLDQGVRNFVHCSVVIQANSGFDVDTGAALYLTVAAEVAAEVTGRLGISSGTELDLNCGSSNL